jgi:carbonic anhydrase
MQKIVQGIRRFQQDIFPQNRALFQRLAAGQSPEALFVGCSDSRISVDLITQTAPGDLFVCRNAGNIVPAHGGADAVSATIEYAVCALRVKHIVVCGHSDCGAMKGLLCPDKVCEMPHVKSWLQHAEGARRALPGCKEDADDRETLEALTKLNVRLQLEHLRTHPCVFAHVQSGELELHGWVYKIESGDVHTWDASASRWAPISESLDFYSTARPLAVA